MALATLVAGLAGSPIHITMDDMATRSTRLRAAAILLPSVLLLAALVRLWGLTTFPVMQDELYTLRDASRFFERPIYSRPLYFLVQNLLLQLGPSTLLMLRLPPFLLGLLGVWLTWKLGRRWFGSTAGLAAAFLVAVSPWHTFASQFARYWSLVYVLIIVLCLILPFAIDKDHVGGYLAVLATIVAAALAHPTALFPIPGILLAVHLLSEDGRLKWRWPTRKGWLYLWGPLMLCALGGLILARTFKVYSGAPPRPLIETLRVVPAMVQWLSPVVVVAAALGALLLARRSSGRRPAAIAILGGVSGLVTLILASSQKAVYADYGMAMLPLTFVTIGGAVQRSAEMVQTLSRAFACGLTLIIATGAAPQLASHLVDGTRFDFRPAYAYIQRSAPDRLVLTWPIAVARYYAPKLRFERLRLNPNFLDATLADTDGFWLVATQRRYGLVAAREGSDAWIHEHCRTVLTTEKGRFDFRVYRVKLLWCGRDPPHEAF